MKKFALLPFFAFLGAAVLTGCASVAVTHEGPNTVFIQNDGCFLFSAIPLFSGDPDYPNQQVCNWFSNTVNLETNVRLLNETAQHENALGVKNVVSRPDEESIFFFLLKRKIMKTSAELIK